MLGEMLENVRRSSPLIHNITNYVTVNDCANILLACGASPIMADDVDEAEEISSLCAGTNINIGTLNQRTIPAMLKAGKQAVALGHPVGSSGCRILVTRMYEMRRRGLKYGLATLCIAGGMGQATVIEMCD